MKATVPRRLQQYRHMHHQVTTRFRAGPIAGAQMADLVLSSPSIPDQRSQIKILSSRLLEYLLTIRMVIFD